jgi:SAM-dependent methyltransferase
VSVDSKWNEIHSQREWGKYPNEHVVAFVMKTFAREPDRKKIRVLDLGFGGGGNLKFLAEQGFDAHGIDGSEHATRRTQAFLTEQGLEARLASGDMTSLAMFPDSTFQLVIDVRSMSNVPRRDVSRVVSEVHRVLAGGGYFLTLLYGTGCMAYQRGRQVEPSTFTDVPEGPFAGIGTVTIYDVPAVRDLLRDFSLVTHRRILEDDTSGNWSFEDHFVVCRKDTGDGKDRTNQ